MLKIYNIFLDMRPDVQYNPAKFEIKIQLMYGKITKTNCIMGRMN